MVQIINAAGSSPRNDSPYLIDRAKMDACPRGCYEMDGPRDRASASDRQTTRLWYVPWSERRQFEDWALGYSTSEIDAAATPAAVDAARKFFSTVDDRGVPLAVARLLRVIPAQDPERPWLFCSEAEVVQGYGAVVPDPNNYLLDRDGIVLEPGVPDADGVVANVPVVVPCLAYVDNCEGEDGAVIVADFDDPILFPNNPRSRADEKYRDGACQYRLTYRPREYSVLTDAALAILGGNELRRYVQRHEEFGLEAIPLSKLAAADPANALRFAEGPYVNEIINEAGVQQHPLATLNYTWIDVPDLPWGAYARCLGRVNQGPFDGFRGRPIYPAGSLLCLPWRTKQTTGPTGRITWQIQYRFSFRAARSDIAPNHEIGWNVFPSANGKFYLATWGGNAAGERVYKSADYNTLFMVPPPVDYLN